MKLGIVTLAAAALFRGRKRVRVSLSSRHGEDRCGAREESDVNGGADGRRQEISRRRRSAAQGRQASGIGRYACQGNENPEHLKSLRGRCPRPAEWTPRPFAWRFSFDADATSPPAEPRPLWSRDEDCSAESRPRVTTRNRRRSPLRGAPSPAARVTTPREDCSLSGVARAIRRAPLCARTRAGCDEAGPPQTP